MRSILRLLLPGVLLFSVGCDDEAPAGPQYFEQFIQPILTANCVRNQASCHKDDGTGNAVGNLDVTSYKALTTRRDVLRTFGSYPLPLLLIKAAGTAVPPIPYQGASYGAAAAGPSPSPQPAQLIPSEILHVGGSTISVDSSAFLELQRWMDSGANEDGSVTVRPRQSGVGSCRKDFAQVRPDVAAQIGTVDTNAQAFKDFASNVEPVIATNCAIGTCHSAEQSDFFLTCQGSGSDDATKFNYLEAQQYVAAQPDTSLILLKPLAPSAGGISHTGGTFFGSKDDKDWKNLSAWATEVGASSAAVTLSAGQQFFNANVMPIFLKRGCALEACHSPGSPNDFKLRAGSPGGFFSNFALDFNYREARENFLMADVPDVRQTRLVKKPVINYFSGGIGLPHRGGPPMQSDGDPINMDPTLCPAWTPASTPFCTMVEWHRIERAALLASGQVDKLAAGDALPVVYVQRTPDADRAIDFDTFRGGSDLMLGSVTLGNLGALNAGSATAGTSLLANCPGVQPPDGTGLRPNVDVRGPDVSYDAKKVAFALRVGAADTLDIYEVTLDAARTCTKITDGNGQSQNGILKHNLDPMYAPDGSLVFASTRGRPDTGPTRSLKYLLPQTDLWRVHPNGSGGYGAPEQMTALLGSELSPAMMLNGQVSFTAEKASADFYQLSGRRINWDLTDYHPLLAQRAKSPALGDADLAPGHAMHQSIGYQQATEIREGLDRNFVLILSDVGARGQGGTVGIFNRSVGPFSVDLNGNVTYLGALTVPDPAATGRAGATQGAYRSPIQLPDGNYLVSYAPDVTDLSTAASVRYDLMVLDPKTGGRTPLGALVGGAVSRVEAMPVYKREPRQGFHNLTQLVFGGHVDSTDASHGYAHYPDLPMLGTLLGANIRSGRFVDALRKATQLAVYQDGAPPSDVASAMAGQTGSQMVFQNRTKLGTASLESDGSVQVRVPALTPLILELRDASDNIVFTMAEEDQLGPGERISRGVPQPFFNSVCGGCHGSVSGRELDIAQDQDALTRASASLARDPSKAVSLGN